MVISYSHLVTVWKKDVPLKRKAVIKSVNKWLKYRAVIEYKVIDQGKYYCQKDPKNNDLSVEMKSCLHGYTGCGLDDFDKIDERTPDKFTFQNHFS